VKITDSFYTTKPADIVSEHERIFGVKVCATCTNQLIKAYQNLKTYYKNDMVKKVIKEGLQLRKEFEGNTYSNGKISVILSDVLQEDITKIFTKEEINIYFEQVTANI
jgi:hypothetical protein